MQVQLPDRLFPIVIGLPGSDIVVFPLLLKFLMQLIAAMQPIRPFYYSTKGFLSHTPVEVLKYYYPTLLLLQVLLLLLPMPFL